MIIHGDSFKELSNLADETVDCVVTSPPYWLQRDYGEEDQFGLEKTFDEYLYKLCLLFDEIKRVLKPTGVVFVNIGDTYTTPKTAKLGIKNNMSLKSMCLIPEHFAIAMSKHGWIVRNDIIWQKPSITPSPVKDRFSCDFEHVYMFVKQKRYYFNQQLEPLSISTQQRAKYGWKGSTNVSDRINSPQGIQSFGERFAPSKGRNMRCVWKINTAYFKGARFAVMPEELVERLIKAGCPKDGTVLDPFFVFLTIGVVAKQLKRDYIGIELNANYIKMANDRIAKTTTQSQLF